ncbi:PKD domain-containing protein [Patescibacteria group bacterium]|nr:PKD domain-containing protein [Patescibacteria group bacterium]MBU1016214.1 PKD domain-containing protein [Patescibacteria group bacterium]MBU1684669.1 PKD domain-containing protein [Patescibacteria group bacterium]MBU1938920.1 PKD domain-containing protein [Patescibacteria group bacterium]
MMRQIRLLVILMAFLWVTPVLAQDFTGDLSLEEGSIRTENYVIVGKTVRIYATVKNNSEQDLFGTVKFYDEKRAQFIGEDQPVSVIAGGTDDVFVDWVASSVGDYPVSARVIPWKDDGDNPNNNKITTSIYVDVDTDSDGIPNRQDSDDDNDGTSDKNDAFPLNPAEWQDTDGDGKGNNADVDDDGDGVTDIEDMFPNDAKETVDTDGDGVGDNSDAFPEDPKENADADQDGLGDNVDPNSKNKGPVPYIDTESNIVSAGTVVTFNALKANDPDGEIVTYEWDFGEGVENTGVIADKIFEKPGTYEVKLKVFDDKGEYRIGKLTITAIYRWQTFALVIIGLLLFLFLLYMVANSKKVLDKKSKKK